MRFNGCMGLLLALTFHAQAACIKEFPSEVRRTWVAEHVEIDGKIMAIMELRSGETSEGLLQRVEQLWRQQQRMIHKSTAGRWKIISIFSEDCQTTFQADTSSPTALGYLSQARPGSNKTKKDLSEILPQNVTINSRMDSLDEGRRGIVATFKSKASQKVFKEELMAKMKEEGWKDLTVQENPPLTFKGELLPRMVLEGGKNKRRAQVVFWRAKGETMGVLNVADEL